jgi:hypothetical protein
MTAADVCEGQMFGVTRSLLKEQNVEKRDAALLLCADNQGRAVLRALGGSDPLMPTRPAYRSLRENEFVVLSRLRLGLPPTEETLVDGDCPLCYKPVNSVGTHSLMCGHGGEGGNRGGRATRHGVVMDVITSEMRNVERVGAENGVAQAGSLLGAGDEPRVEDYYNRKPGSNPEVHHRADFAFQRTNGTHATVNLGDLTLVTPNTENAKQGDTANVDGAAAAAAHETKIKTYTANYDVIPGTLHPMAYETLGRGHTTNKATLQLYVKGMLPPVAENWTLEQKNFYKWAVRHLREAIDVAVAKATAASLLRGERARKREVGTGRGAAAENLEADGSPEGGLGG